MRRGAEGGRLLPQPFFCLLFLLEDFFEGFLLRRVPQPQTHSQNPHLRRPVSNSANEPELPLFLGTVDEKREAQRRLTPYVFCRPTRH